MTRKKTKKAVEAQQASDTPGKEREPSGLDLAAEILKEHGGPLSCPDIAQRVIAKGWKTQGKTPASTLRSAMTREILKKGLASRFRKHGRGTFTATEVP
jgi:hypothetical protein